MHPPLERPHPKCQEIIEALNLCHAQKYSKIIFWKCNETKYQLDKCFKEEKQEMLQRMQQQEALDDVRKEEDAALRKEPFEEFLKRDEDYQRIAREQRQRKL